MLVADEVRLSVYGSPGWNDIVVDTPCVPDGWWPWCKESTPGSHICYRIGLALIRNDLVMFTYRKRGDVLGE